MPGSSSTAGTVNDDGAAMVVTEGDPANHTALLKKRQCEATFTTSCDEEKAVMRMALGWRLPSHAAAAICADSESLFKASGSNYRR